MTPVTRPLREAVGGPPDPLVWTDSEALRARAGPQAGSPGRAALLPAVSPASPEVGAALLPGCATCPWSLLPAGMGAAGRPSALRSFGRLRHPGRLVSLRATSSRGPRACGPLLRDGMLQFRPARSRAASEAPGESPARGPRPSKSAHPLLLRTRRTARTRRTKREEREALDWRGAGFLNLERRLQEDIPLRVPACPRALAAFPPSCPSRVPLLESRQARVEVSSLAPKPLGPGGPRRHHDQAPRSPLRSRWLQAA